MNTRAVIRLLAASGAIALGCDLFTDPPPTGGLLVNVQRAASASDSIGLERAALIDAARARIIGPDGDDPQVQVINLTQRTAAFVDTIVGLQPGTYTVVLEGLTADEVEEYGRTVGVRVTAGSNTTTNVVVGSFRPSIASVGPLAGSLGFTVNVSSVTGADAYTVSWASDATFSNASETSVAATAGTAVPVTVTVAQAYFVRVRATNEYGANGVWSEPVSVGLLVPAASIELSPGGGMLTAVQDTLLLTATVRDENGDVLGGKVIMWSSSNEGVATVDAGAVVAAANGITTITATVDAVDDMVSVTVAQITESVTVVAPADTLFVGGSFQFLGAARDRRGHPNPDVMLEWDSSDDAVATVNGAGAVHGVEEGDVTITASHSGKSGVAEVTLVRAMVPVLGLVADYPFTGNARDVSGNGNDGSAIGASLTVDRFGNANSAYTFDGVDDLVDIGSNVKPDLPFTVTAWVSTTQPGLVFGNDQWHHVTLGLYRGARVEVTTDGLLGRTGTGNVASPIHRAGQMGSSPGLLSGTWHHIAVNFVAHDSMQLYVDGALLESEQTDGTGAGLSYSGANGGIGGLPIGESVFTGDIDDVKVFNRLLARQEILALVADTGVAALPVDSVVILPAAPSVEERSSVLLSAQPRDALGNAFDGLVVSWMSLDPGTATVDASGLVTGVLFGAARITATAGGITDTTEVTVTPFPVDSVEVSPTTDSVSVGDTAPFVATPYDSLGNVLEQRVVVWNVGSPAVASVDNAGTALGLATGTSTVEATIGGVTGQATVIVFSNASVDAVIVTPEMTTLPVGADVQLQVTLRDAMGNDLVGRLVTWETSAPTVVAINNLGLASAISVGSATITATSETITDDVTVTVEAVASTYKAVAAGHTHTCAITTNGVLFCWGFNTSGQLGDGGTTNSNMPVRVVGGHVFDNVGAARVHTCGISNQEDAWCWGNAATGRLGDGTGTASITPVSVAGSLPFAGVQAHQDHACAVTPTGSAYCWGKNGRELFTISTGGGRLGDGTEVDRGIPTLVAGGLSWNLVSTGSWHSCGLTINGASYCWGSNGGRFGDGTSDRSLTPVQTTGGLVFTDLDAGLNHTCGIAGSLVRCWGANPYGELGDNSTTTRLVPTLVSGALAFSEIEAGSEFTCGLTTAGSAYCWGRNNVGQLGNGTNDDSLVPIPVAGGLTFVSLAAGEQHSCGITATDDVYCWGRGTNGELGNGANANSNVPVRASTP